MGSQMLLLPNQRLGIFFAVNTRDIGPVTTQHMGFQRAFFDHYFPRQQPGTLSRLPISPGGLTAMSACIGERVTRLPLRIKLATSSVASPTGSALQAMARSSCPWKASSCALLKWSLYFRQIDGSSSLVFFEDDQGRITRFYTDFAPQYSAKGRHGMNCVPSTCHW